MELSPLYTALDQLLSQKDFVILAIDGPCASGKSTLAQTLGTHYHAPVLHMDDFFLPPDRRTATSLTTPGENIDSQRFGDEVLTPLAQHLPFSFLPWRCKTGTWGEEIFVEPSPLTIIEGAYSLRPDWRNCYDLRVFLSAPLPLRENRILHRNGQEGLATFQNRWIPLEDAYFEGCDVEESCHISLSFS